MILYDVSPIDGAVAAWQVSDSRLSVDRSQGQVVVIDCYCPHLAKTLDVTFPTTADDEKSDASSRHNRYHDDVSSSQHGGEWRINSPVVPDVTVVLEARPSPIHRRTVTIREGDEYSERVAADNNNSTDNNGGDCNMISVFCFRGDNRKLYAACSACCAASYSSLVGGGRESLMKGPDLITSACWTDLSLIEIPCPNPPPEDPEALSQPHTPPPPVSGRVYKEDCRPSKLMQLINTEGPDIIVVKENSQELRKANGRGKKNTMPEIIARSTNNYQEVFDLGQQEVFDLGQHEVFDQGQQEVFDLGQHEVFDLGQHEVGLFELGQYRTFEQGQNELLFDQGPSKTFDLGQHELFYLGQSRTSTNVVNDCEYLQPMNHNTPTPEDRLSCRATGPITIQPNSTPEDSLRYDAMRLKLKTDRTREACRRHKESMTSRASYVRHATSAVSSCGQSFDSNNENVFLSAIIRRNHDRQSLFWQ